MARYEIWVVVPVMTTVDEEMKTRPGKFTKKRKAIRQPRYWKGASNQMADTRGNEARQDEAQALQVKNFAQQFYVRDRDRGNEAPPPEIGLDHEDKGVH